MAPLLLLSSLPSELLTKILLLLPLKSLLAISSTSTLFRSLFLDSAVLQYSFLLQFTHMKDADPTAMSALERYNELKERDQRWRSMTWKKRQAVVSENGDNGSLYDLLGGVLALGLQAPCTTLEFSKLPTTRGTSTDVPTTQFTPGFIIKDFTMDPSQDLLVLIETITPPKVGGRPVRRHSYKIHLYTLSTFQPHPLAKEQILTWPYWVSNQRSSPFISIQDSMVALHANASEETKTEGGVAIWDWKRGVMVAAQASSATEIIESFSFLAPALFLVAVFDVHEEEALLNLYAFDPTYTPPAESTSDNNASSASSIRSTSSSIRSIRSTAPPPADHPSPKLIAEYHFPALKHRPNIMTIRLDPSPGVGDSVPPFAEGQEGEDNGRPMFQPDGEERLVLIDLQFVVEDPHNAWQGIEERYSIFVLKSTLVKALRHFPHLDPNGNGPRPTSHLETPSVSELSLKVDEASGSAQPTTSSFDGDEDVEEDDGGDENWEDAEEGSGDDGEWEDHDDELDGKGGGAIHYAWEDWAERTRMLQNLPLPHAWVLFIYHCKFVHAVGHQVRVENEAIPSADISARVLDFSPNSCALLAPTQASSLFAPSPTVYVPPAPDPQPPLEKREDGDVGRLISKKTTVKATENDVWEEDVVTGLEYVERPMPVFLREGPAGGNERLSGLCIDEQRLVWVKRNTQNHALVLDVHMF